MTEWTGLCIAVPRAMRRPDRTRRATASAPCLSTTVRAAPPPGPSLRSGRLQPLVPGAFRLGPARVDNREAISAVRRSQAVRRGTNGAALSAFLRIGGRKVSRSGTRTKHRQSGRLHHPSETSAVLNSSARVRQSADPRSSARIANGFRKAYRTLSPSSCGFESASSRKRRFSCADCSSHSNLACFASSKLDRTVSRWASPPSASAPPAHVGSGLSRACAALERRRANGSESPPARFATMVSIAMASRNLPIRVVETTTVELNLVNCSAGHV